MKTRKASKSTKRNARQHTKSEAITDEAIAELAESSRTMKPLLGTRVRTMAPGGEVEGPIVEVGPRQCVIQIEKGDPITRRWSQVKLVDQQADPTGSAQTWHDVRSKASMDEGAQITRREPKRVVPVLCRPGMVVSLTNHAEDCAQVTSVTPEFCICVTEKGEALALYWGEVELTHVLPDPAALDRQERTASPLFELVDCEMVPRLTGRPDGKLLFTSAQAAKIRGGTPEKWDRLWAAQYGWTKEDTAVRDRD